MSSLLPTDYQAPADLLAGKVILITGAADGIGRALAIAAGRHGASVVLLDRDLRRLELVYDAIEAAGGPQPALFPLNLEAGGPNEYQEMATALENNFGALHGLVHNAAALGKPAPTELYDIEAWYRVLQTNLGAPFLITRACLPLMRKSGDASIVFMSDQVGRQGRAYWGAYGVTKFGAEGLMQILAHELDNTAIRVNSVDPGPLRTALRRSAYPGEDPTTLPPPEHAVPALLYLLGAQGRHLHGQALALTPGDVAPGA